MKNKKIKLKYILLSILIIVVCIAIGITYNQNKMSKWLPTDELIGSWVGSVDFNINDKNKDYYTVQVDIEIVIYEDGTISGTVGDAQLTDCYISLNRTTLERLININTDYVINFGHIDGKVFTEDNLDYRDISMPFNITNNTIVGSLFHIESLKYPDPLVTSLELKQE